MGKKKITAYECDADQCGTLQIAATDNTAVGVLFTYTYTQPSGSTTQQDAFACCPDHMALIVAPERLPIEGELQPC